MTVGLPVPLPARQLLPRLVVAVLPGSLSSLEQSACVPPARAGGELCVAFTEHFQGVRVWCEDVLLPCRLQGHPCVGAQGAALGCLCCCCPGGAEEMTWLVFHSLVERWAEMWGSGTLGGLLQSCFLCL